MKILKVFNKKIIFPVLGMIMFSLSGCIKPTDNIQQFDLVTAIVDVDETFQPTIRTPLGIFSAPELQSDLYTKLFERDAILTSFKVNYDQQTSSKYLKVYDMIYRKLETRLPQATPDGQTTGTYDYDVSIEKMVILNIVDNILFFAFRHTAPSDQEFIYEMTYDGNKTDEIPMVYIRAGNAEPQGSKEEKIFDYPYAFNMRDFFATFKDANNRVKFKIKYKTGVDDEGNDKYEDYIDAALGAVIEIKIE